MAQKQVNDKIVLRKINIDDINVDELTQESILQYLDTDVIRYALFDKLFANLSKCNQEIEMLENKSRQLMELLGCISDKRVNDKMSNDVSKKIIKKKVQSLDSDSNDDVEEVDDVEEPEPEPEPVVEIKQPTKKVAGRGGAVKKTSATVAKKPATKKPAAPKKTPVKKVVASKET